MAKFLPAIKVVLDQEGWGEYTENPGDPPTKYGITINTLEKWRTPLAVIKNDVKNLTLSEAMEIYEHWYWNTIHGDGITDQQLATKLLSMDVNTGPHETIELLQRCLNQDATGQVALDVDGTMGPLTLACCNSTDPVALISKLCQAQWNFYKDYAKRDPTKEIYLAGWKVRAAWPNCLATLT